MPDIAFVRRQAMRQYEVGRLRFAARVALVIVPFTIVAAHENGAIFETAILGGVLLVLAVIMRWRSRRGAEAVRAGLGGGAVPALAALALCRIAPSCPPSVALGLCAGAGLVSGAIAGRTAIRHAADVWRQWAGVVVVAALTTALGCLAIGYSTIAGAAIVLALGAAVMIGLQRRASA